MGKIKITENDLRNCIEEAVVKTLNEGFWSDMKSGYQFVLNGHRRTPVLYITNGSNSVLLEPGKKYSWKNINSNRNDDGYKEDSYEDEEGIGNEKEKDLSGKLFKIGTGYRGETLTLNAYDNAKISINGYLLKPGTAYTIQRGQEIDIEDYNFNII